jgi:hypothetical protein
MEIFMMENFSMEVKMAKESILIVMVVFMMVDGKMTKRKDMES